MPPAAPTQAELILQLRRLMAIYRQLASWGGGSATGGDMVELEEDVVDALRSDYPDEISSAVAQMRARLATIYDNSAPLRAHLKDWARLIGVDPDTPIADLLADWYGYAVANGMTVAPRTFSFGAPTPSSGNVGSGNILRYSTDARSYQMQGAYGADSYLLRCVSDAAIGSRRNAEVWQVRSLPAGRDSLEPSGGFGAGVDELLTTTDPRDLPMLNASLDQFDGASSGAMTGVTNWTSRDGVSSSTYNMSSTSYLPARDSFDTVRALNFIGTNDLLTQRADLSSLVLDPDTLYYNGLAYLSSVSGSLHIRAGAVSTSVVVSASQADWAILEITGSYYRGMASDPLTWGIEFVGMGSGGILVGPAWPFAPFTAIGYTWWFARPGATPFLAGTVKDGTGDIFRATDTLPVDTVIQRQLARLFNGFYLPYAASAGAATIAEPS